MRICSDFTMRQIDNMRLFWCRQSNGLTRGHWRNFWIYRKISLCVSHAVASQPCTWKSRLTVLCAWKMKYPDAQISSCSARKRDCDPFLLRRFGEVLRASREIYLLQRRGPWSESAALYPYRKTACTSARQHIIGIFRRHTSPTSTILDTKVE